jgi:hypothetical protein
MELPSTKVTFGALQFHLRLNRSVFARSRNYYAYSVSGYAFLKWWHIHWHRRDPYMQSVSSSA